MRNFNFDSDYNFLQRWIRCFSFCCFNCYPTAIMMHNKMSMFDQIIIYHTCFFANLPFCSNQPKFITWIHHRQIERVSLRNCLIRISNENSLTLNHVWCLTLNCIWIWGNINCLFLPYNDDKIIPRTWGFFNTEITSKNGLEIENKQIKKKLYFSLILKEKVMFDASMLFSSIFELFATNQFIKLYQQINSLRNLLISINYILQKVLPAKVFQLFQIVFLMSNIVVCCIQLNGLPFAIRKVNCTQTVVVQNNSLMYHKRWCYLAYIIETSETQNERTMLQEHVCSIWLTWSLNVRTLHSELESI